MVYKLVNLLSFVGIAVFALGQTACLKTESNMITSINPLDIVDARVLYSTEANQTKSQQSANLFKITADKRTSEVIVRDQNGNPINMSHCQVKNLSEDLIYLGFWAQNGGIHVNGLFEYIVRKSDGAVFVVPFEINQQLRNLTRIDGNNNIYTIGHGKTWDEDVSAIYRISSNLSSGLSAQRLTSEYRVKYPFLSDHNGNILFNILDDKIILRTISGVYCLSDVKIDCNKLFTLKGQNGFFYFERNKLYSFEPNESLSKIEKREVASYSQNMSCNDIFDVIYKHDKTIILCNSGICIIHDINNVKLIKNGIDRYQHNDMRIVDKYYYWNEKPGYSVNNKIIRFDVENETIETIFYNENYTVENFTCDIDGGVTFKGMNLMTGRKIKGTIVNKTFSETPLTDDDEFDAKVINFIQIR